MKVYYRYNTINRFEKHVKYNNVNGCIEWTGAKNKQGYGQTSFSNNGKTENWYAHRLSYVLFIGELENSKIQVCHKCDNPCCVNPFHLFKGTAKDNHRDAQSKGRRNAPIHPSRDAFRKGCRCDDCHKLELEYQREFYTKNLEHSREVSRQKYYRRKEREALR